MTTRNRPPITMADIERRLRFAAPDEPVDLPALMLPGWAGAVGRVPVRMRGRATQPHRLRLLVAVVALVALLATVVTAGALRLLDKQSPLDDLCLFDPATPVDPGCLALELPEGWTMFGAGQLQAERFSEAGLAVDYVQQVMANVPLGGCASPGGPWPTGYPSGTNEVTIPEATPDAGLACVRDAALPDNGIRIVTIRAVRIRGVEADFPIVDTSEPTESAGWTEEIAGRPARLTVTSSEVDGRQVETRIWDVLAPGRIESVLRVRADIAGPDLEAGRATVDDLIQKVRFIEPEPPPIDEADADNVLRRTLDTLDRHAREMGSDFFRCFPRTPGSQAGSISGGEYTTYASSLEVTCTSAISPSLAGLWRIALETSWVAGGGYAADTIRTEYFTSGTEIGEGFNVDYAGGYPRSIAGRSMPREGSDGWYPNARPVLPPPLTGPLDIPPGSIVEVLYPGTSSGPLGEQTFDGGVGSRLYIFEGPVVIDGEEWYLVNPGNPGSWVRATRDGRPLLKAVAPACLTGDMPVGELSWQIPAERLLCYGSDELTLEPAVFARDENLVMVPELCGDETGIGPCPTGVGEPDWLTVPTGWVLFGPAGPAGPDNGLPVWLDPSTSTPNAGAQVRVRGHFDDSRATGCVIAPYGASGLDLLSPAIQELYCRERFVVTAIEPL